jgi:hypothetical protein
MTSPILYFLGAVVVAEAYKKFTTSEEKFDWENWIKMHHGEVGAIATILGVATKSPRLAAVGLGLALHDINDAPKWFSSNKQNIQY